MEFYPNTSPQDYVGEDGFELKCPRCKCGKFVIKSRETAICASCRKPITFVGGLCEDGGTNKEYTYVSDRVDFADGEKEFDFCFTKGFLRNMQIPLFATTYGYGDERLTVVTGTDGYLFVLGSCEEISAGKCKNIYDVIYGEFAEDDEPTCREDGNESGYQEDGSDSVHQEGRNESEYQERRSDSVHQKDGDMSVCKESGSGFSCDRDCGEPEVDFSVLKKGLTPIKRPADPGNYVVDGLLKKFPGHPVNKLFCNACGAGKFDYPGQGKPVQCFCCKTPQNLPGCASGDVYECDGKMVSYYFGSDVMPLNFKE